MSETCNDHACAAGKKGAGKLNVIIKPSSYTFNNTYSTEIGISIKDPPIKLQLSYSIKKHPNSKTS